MVWLKENINWVTTLNSQYFNSNMVWLKVTPSNSLWLASRNFNSNMVWLKGESVKKATTQEAFQFQYGLIKSSISSLMQNIIMYFNSNMVWLKVTFEKEEFDTSFYFNSNMVWLKEIWRVYSLNSMPSFQFQYGLIKSINKGEKSELWQYFNSNMVWLKGAWDECWRTD